MLFDLDKSGKILKNVQVDFSRGKLQLLIIWNINCINCSEHVLRVKRGGGGGGQNRFTHWHPYLFHFFELQPLNLMCFFIIIIIIMWSIYSECIPCCSHQSNALGSVCLKESSSSDSDVGRSLEGVCRLFGPALPWHTYHSFRLVTWGERFDERFLWGSRFGERASPIVVDEGW